MSSFEEEMAQYDEEWTEKQDEPDAFGTIPAGKHRGVVKISRIEPMGDQGGWRWGIMFTHHPDCSCDAGGGSAWANINLDNEVGREIAAKTAARMGFRRPLSELREACETEEFIGLDCDLFIKVSPGEKRDFTDVYVNSVRGKTEDVGSFAATTPEDDIPF